jgi:hypothetical protein
MRMGAATLLACSPIHMGTWSHVLRAVLAWQLAWMCLDATLMRG